MNKDNIVNVKVRMNLSREEDALAWENLRKLDRKKYKSYSRAFIKAINFFSENERRPKEDSLRERRKEQEELLRLIAEEVKSTVQTSLMSVAIIPQGQAAMSTANSTVNIPSRDAEEVPSPEQAVLMDEALDFVNGF